MASIPNLTLLSALSCFRTRLLQILEPARNLPVPLFLRLRGMFVCLLWPTALQVISRNQESVADFCDCNCVLFILSNGLFVYAETAAAHSIRDICLILTRKFIGFWNALHCEGQYWVENDFQNMRASTMEGFGVCRAPCSSLSGMKADVSFWRHCQQFVVSKKAQQIIGFGAWQAFGFLGFGIFCSRNVGIDVTSERSFRLNSL